MQIMRTVQESFGPTAQAYGTSAIHNNLTELATLVQIVSPRSTDSLLDVATGAGNTALAFAPFCAKVVALDITPQMTAEVERRSAEAGLKNLTTSLSDGALLPFADHEFDIVTNRLALHHFANVPEAMIEAHRVLKPGGKLLISDNYSPEDDLLAQNLDELERLRDPSHHWSLKISQWKQVLSEAGFYIDTFQERDEWSNVRMDFQEWMDRIRTPGANRPRLAEIFSDPTSPIGQFLSVEIEAGRTTFSLPRFTVLAIAR